MGLPTRWRKQAILTWKTGGRMPGPSDAPEACYASRRLCRRHSIARLQVAGVEVDLCYEVEVREHRAQQGGSAVRRTSECYTAVVGLPSGCSKQVHGPLILGALPSGCPLGLGRFFLGSIFMINIGCLFDRIRQGNKIVLFSSKFLQPIFNALTINTVL